MNFTRNDIHSAIKISVNPEGSQPYDWSIQGFGMLRLHLPNDWRLNIWHPDYAVVGISDIHDHQWDFVSYVVNGRMESLIYQQPVFAAEHAKSERYHCKRIKPGPSLVDLAPLEDMLLHEHFRHRCTKGQHYRQAAHEIHRSVFSKGCVTLIKRERRGLPDEARTFWPQGTQWISAEPRQATRSEVLAFCEAALENWK